MGKKAPDGKSSQAVSLSARDRINIPEVYHNILSYLTRSEWVKLMRVSLLWYELAGPMVYRDLIYHVDDHNTPVINPFAILSSPAKPDSPKQIKQKSSTNGSNKTQPKRTRTPKIDLLKHCHILRAQPHLSNVDYDDNETGVSSCAMTPLDLTDKLNPTILVLQILSAGNSDAQEYRHHLNVDMANIISGGSPCAAIQHLSPKKLIVKDWWGTFPTGIDSIPFWKGIEKVVVTVSRTVLGRRDELDGKDGGDPESETGDCDWSFGTGEECDDIVFVFQGLEEDVDEDCPYPSIRQSRVKDLAKELVFHLDNEEGPQRKVTFVNSKEVQLKRLLTEQWGCPEPHTFPTLLKKAFLEYPMVEAAKLEEMWKKVMFLSKEEYINGNRRELVEELNGIKW